MLDYLRQISPALISLLIGGYWLNRFFVARGNLAALIERICDLLDHLRQDCSEYWSVPHTAEDDAEHGVLEAKIKGQVVLINSLVRLVGDKRRHIPEVVPALILDLVDACTGGDFETKGRKADKLRLMRIVSLSSKIAVELQRLKLWAGVWPDVIGWGTQKIGNLFKKILGHGDHT